MTQMSKVRRRPVRPWRLATMVAGSAFVALFILAATFAPYVYAELSRWIEPHVIVDPAPAGIAKGRLVDDYFAVQAIGPGVWGIGEPRYYQENYSYLIVGQSRAVLFDSGSGTRDIRPVITGLTTLPVTVIVSHLHYDHLGGVRPFGGLAMIDLPQTRADVSGERFTPTRYQYLGFIDGLRPPSVRVSEWLKPGEVIDLGGRTLTVLYTPGHTSNSISLFDRASRRLFSGDFIYPTMLYAFLPDASLSAYRRTADRLLATLPSDTVLWSAHCCRSNEGISAPWLTITDLRDLNRTLDRIEAGEARPTGFYPRRFAVNNQMILATGFAWNNR